MKIKSIDIQNFRKLKSVNINISDETTVFVGANNSGKTSAMIALQYFLVNPKGFSIRDFTLSNWKCLNKIGKKIEKSIENTVLESEKILFIDEISQQLNLLLPSLDIWFDVPEQDIHHMIPLIPTLSWTQGLLGIRIIFQPNDIENLMKSFLNERTKANNRKLVKLKEHPKSFTDFLENHLQSHFSLKIYKLDPSKYDTDNNPQELPLLSTPIQNTNILKSIIQVDFLDAQHLDDKDTTSLSRQLRNYYNDHLNPTSQDFSPDNQNNYKNDIDALKTLEKASDSFDKNLGLKFSPSFEELQTLGYPNIDSPIITMNAIFNTQNTLEHSSEMLYSVPSNPELKLPETYAGLGYRNLISIIFRLMSYRDAWMKVGNLENSEEPIPPIHLVIVEEPEAHLHAQVQQVFIRKAYDRLRDHSKLHKKTDFTSHLLISTHSSHIAHETKFSNLRYFKKRIASTNDKIPLTDVINLTNTFGDDLVTEKFVTRYLKLTHSDLLFADALIIVEGQAERILVPDFIINDDNFKKLTESYITLLELGGSHTHRIIPLVNKLGLTTLVIADLDSVDKDNANKKTQQHN